MVGFKMGMKRFAGVLGKLEQSRIYVVQGTDDSFVSCELLSVFQHFIDCMDVSPCHTNSPDSTFSYLFFMSQILTQHLAVCETCGTIHFSLCMCIISWKLVEIMQGFEKAKQNINLRFSGIFKQQNQRKCRIASHYQKISWTKNRTIAKLFC